MVWYKRRPIKIGLIVFVTLLILGGGLASLSYYKVIAIGLPIFEGSPSAPSHEEEYVPDQIIVKFKPGTPSEAVEQLNSSLGTEVIFTSPSLGFKVLRIPAGKTVAEMVDIYSKQAIVEYAEPNYVDYALPTTKQAGEKVGVR